jgi:hypothetical protein
MEATRRESEQVFAEGVARRFPLAMSRMAVELLLSKRGVPVPTDVLLWVSAGKASDKDVTDWLSPTGA